MASSLFSFSPPRSTPLIFGSSLGNNGRADGVVTPGSGSPLRNFQPYTPPRFYNPEAAPETPCFPRQRDSSSPPAFIFSAGNHQVNRSGTPSTPPPAPSPALRSRLMLTPGEKPPPFVFSAGGGQVAPVGTPGIPSPPSSSPLAARGQLQLFAPDRSDLVPTRVDAAAAATPMFSQFGGLSLSPRPPAEATPAVAATSPSRPAPSSGIVARVPTQPHQSAVPETQPDIPVTSQPYDPAQELVHEHVFYSAGFREKLESGLDLAGRAVSCIEQALARMPATDTAELQRHLKEAKSLRDFRPAATRTLAFLGDSGQGTWLSSNTLAPPDQHCKKLLTNTMQGRAA